MIDEMEVPKSKTLLTSDDHRFPINPFVIAAKEKINVFHADFSFTDIFGIIKKNQSGTFIYLSRYHEYPLQRFMLAHLLGHYFLHQDRKRPICAYCTNPFLDFQQSEEEREADQFAMQMLLPADKIRKELKIPIQTDRMADLFGVPLTILRQRIEQVKRDGK
ncbi:MAG: ImmA/IrrE family metallo-endopeptidase [Sporolactobacillus sp.]